MKWLIQIQGAITVAAWISLPAFGSDGFSIQGEIPGLKKGMKVELVNKEGKKDTALCITSANDDRFLLSGHLECPKLCELRIFPDEVSYGYRSIALLLENEPFRIIAESIDSLPGINLFSTEDLRLSRKVSVTGGKRDFQYRRILEELYPYEKKMRDAHAQCFKDMKMGKAIDSLRYDRFLREKQACDNAIREYVINNPESSISGFYLSGILRTPFSLTSQELGKVGDSLEKIDEFRREEIANGIGFAQDYLKDADIHDLRMTATDGASVSLKNVLPTDGKYLFVDFWASWCGPCRAALKKLKKLNAKYRDKVEFISISIDEDKEAWLKAVEKEDMTWRQYRVNGETREDARKLYQVNSVPTLILISPEGKIVHYTHDDKPIDLILCQTLR